MSELRQNILEFEYINHLGKRMIRQIVPAGVSFGTTPFCHEPTWLLNGFDLDRKEDRSFELIHVIKFASKTQMSTGGK